jgi:peptide/nickel transport system permease protein
MNYYVERSLQALFTVWAVLTITFVLTRWMPGGPLDFIRAAMVAGDLGPTGGGQITGSTERLQQFDELAKAYVNIAPSAPLHEQYFTWLTQTLQGDMGRSVWFNEPVEDILVPAIPWTVFLGAVSVLISFVTRVVIGAALAYREGSWFDIGSTTALLWAHSIPFFLVGIILLYLTAYQWSVFPTGGRLNPAVDPGLNWPFISGVLNYAFLPVVSLAWASFGAGAIAMRANSIQVLGEDYLRVANLRGIATKRIATLYVARNAILPMYTQMLIQLGYIFAGSIFIESIFNYKGVGFYIFRAIQARDYPLMMGGFILITVTLVIALYVADLTYGMIDPRVKRDSEAY